MSSKTDRIKWTGLLMAALVACIPVVSADDIIEYYWIKAGQVFEQQNLTTANVPFQVTVRTYYKQIDRHGAVVDLDSATVRYFFHNATIDSQHVISGDNHRFENLDLSFLDVFHANYLRFAYPNDTGGTLLAIGLDTDSGSTDPDGFILIDRNRYDLRWLYLYYPHKEGYRHFSRSFRFHTENGYLFPDSIWEVGMREKIFTRERYRLESRLSDLHVGP